MISEEDKKYLKEEFDKFLNEWLKTDEHNFQCIGYSEGQECCLDKEFVRDKIRQFLLDFIQKKAKL